MKYVETGVTLYANVLRCIKILNGNNQQMEISNKKITSVFCFFALSKFLYKILLKDILAALDL